ncbi:hypothetical protein BST42_27235 [Mycolicibacterium rhodesiae]|uniref:Secreted protein n=1 Tax=Mycolicibacterium rhodesiae TaxID=36814 RepID=A0A1X0IIY5_MYCRH|nr:hypothetical protein BST42_27235 [Mycolicibacterium rhodesiae]
MQSRFLVTGAVGAFAVTASLFSCGVASADAYAGETYSDAAGALSGSGMTVVVGGRVGSELPTEECIVTRSQKAPWVKGSNFQQVNNTMLLFLNCNAAVATAGKPGNSAASPEGQQALKDEQAYEWKSTTEDGAAWCAENMKAHPTWTGNAFDGCPGTGT